jgi:DNA-binding MarR family transcriptional regulator
MTQKNKAKRDEILWALRQQPDYELADLQEIFNIDRVTVWRIINRMPADWKTPWIKK